MDIGFRIYWAVNSVNVVIYVLINCSVTAVHFWAPTFKWGISIANVADFSKPPEKLSYPQQIGMYRMFLICCVRIVYATPRNTWAFINESAIFATLYIRLQWCDFLMFLLFSGLCHQRSLPQELSGHDIALLSIL